MVYNLVAETIFTHILMRKLGNNWTPLKLREGQNWTLVQLYLPLSKVKKILSEMHTLGKIVGSFSISLLSLKRS